MSTLRRKRRVAIQIHLSFDVKKIKRFVNLYMYLFLKLSHCGDHFHVSLGWLSTLFCVVSFVFIRERQKKYHPCVLTRIRDMCPCSDHVTD